MDKSKYAKYEAKRKAVHDQFKKCRRKLWITTLVVFAAVSIAAYLLLVQFKLIPGTYPVYIVFQIIALMLTSMISFGRDKYYINAERNQMILLEQEEPFSRFDI